MAVQALDEPPERQLRHQIGAQVRRVGVRRHIGDHLQRRRLQHAVAEVDGRHVRKQRKQWDERDAGEGERVEAKGHTDRGPHPAAAAPPS